MESADRMDRMLSQIDVLVLTLGNRVPSGSTREQMFKLNAAVFRSSVLAALSSSFKGIVLVITNPVDLMARLVFREAHLDKNRVIGLGTVVESARLQAYSVPCIIGASGVQGREQPASSQTALESCCERLRKTLQQADES
jgi:malate/lactate dehydrogenase